MRRFIAGMLLIGAMGCQTTSAKGAADEADAKARQAASTQPLQLVWEASSVPGEDGEQLNVALVTRVLREQGGKLEVVGELPGALVVADEQVWAITTTATPRPHYRCPDCSAPDVAPECYDTLGEQVEVSRPGLQLATLDKAKLTTLNLFDEPSPEDNAGDYDEALWPMAQVGPYLFVHGSLYRYACGAAHGNSGQDFAVIDVRTGQPVQLLSEAERAKLYAVQAPQAAKLLAQSDALDEEDRAPEKLELTMLAPRVSGQAVSMTYQFTMPSCYACSDGAWSSYTVSASVEADAVPEALAPHTTISPALASYLAQPTSDRLMGRGWSVATGASLAAINAKLAEAAQAAQ